MTSETTTNPRLLPVLGELRQRFPNAIVMADAPDASKGGFIDVAIGAQRFVIECFEAGGFGLGLIIVKLLTKVGAASITCR